MFNEPSSGGLGGGTASLRDWLSDLSQNKPILTYIGLEKPNHTIHAIKYDPPRNVVAVEANVRV
jgi:hypothetical protein